MPKYIHRMKRIESVVEAMGRFIEAGKQIPIEWVEEYNQLIKESEVQ